MLLVAYALCLHAFCVLHMKSGVLTKMSYGLKAKMAHIIFARGKSSFADKLQ